MPLHTKALPPPSLKLVLAPASDPDYKHFEDARDAPFDASASAFSRVNTWWLADASLLAYWNEVDANARFRSPAGLGSRLIENHAKDTQCYLAWSDAFAIVAIRGTEPDRLQDLVLDARAKLVGWDQQAGERVHAGFLAGLNAVWPELAASPELRGRRVWFTGHSLGGAHATLAADRFQRQQGGLGLGALGGIYTFGCPLVGDRGFVDGFNRRCGEQSFRFVNDRDGVARVPPPLFGYRHVNTEHLIGFDDPDVPLISEPLIDHTPRRYAVLAWNALVESL